MKLLTMFGILTILCTFIIFNMGFLVTWVLLEDYQMARVTTTYMSIATLLMCITYLGFEKKLNKLGRNYKL